MKGNCFRFHPDYIYGLLILIGLRSVDGSYFFHEPSSIELTAPDATTDFGFSFAYQLKSNSLMVSSPHADWNGRVYKCAMDAIAKSETPTCSKINIDIDQLAGDYNRSQSKEQNFFLGASLSATPDYIFTCAPLWTSYIYAHEKYEFGALGTCFLDNGSQSYRYNGLPEQWAMNTTAKAYDYKVFFGGIGWKTFYDPINDLMLISNSLFHYSISVLRMDKPLEPVSLVRFDGSYKLLGTDFAAGFFFDKKLLYAFGCTSNSDETGLVAFLYADENKSLEVLKDGKRIITITDTTKYAMYGTSLHSVYLDGDMFSELIVGAPAYSHGMREYERGAVYFYKGGGKVEPKTRSNLCIYSKKDGSRFGTVISSLDIDEDKFPEIFISAPYENENNGAVYILSGYEVTTFFQNASNFIPLSDLKKTQRMVASQQFFGFSLNAIKDFDAYGGNMLAVGAPRSSKVVLYRSVPVVGVFVTTSLHGKEWVQEDDMTFTVRVTVNVTFVEKQKVSDAKIILTTSIKGDPASINNTIYDIPLKNTETKYYVDVEVVLKDQFQGNYQFKAMVKSDDRRLNESRYDRSLVRIRDYSKTESILDVERRCKKGDNCVPSLHLDLTWSGGPNNTYVLGSSKYENISLLVTNNGSASFASCLRVKITGAKIANIECIQTDSKWYRCDLLQMFSHSKRYINIMVDMSKVTSVEKKTEVATTLINNCAASDGETNQNDIHEITYQLNADDIFVNGSSFNRNVTESENSSPIVRIGERFTITNNGSVSWKSLYLLITFKKLPFVQNYSIRSESKRSCSENNFDDQVQYNCTFDLHAKAIVQIWTTTNVIKEDILKNFIDGRLMVTSYYTLFLPPTSKILNETLTSTLYYQTDEQFANNKLLIILVAVIVGIIVIAIIAGILYKVGFFKREQKKKLEILRRQSTIRRERPDDNARSSQGDSQDDIEIIEDSIALQLRNSNYTNEVSSSTSNLI